VASRPAVVTVRTAGGQLENEHPRILVGADGLNSIVSRTLGGLIRAPKTPKLSLSAHVRGSGPDRSSGYMYVSEGLTVGLAATGTRDGWNATVVVKPGNDGREVAAGPTEFLLSRLANARLPWTAAPTLADGPWASGPFDRPVGRIAGEDFVLVGDASGYYDPLTGQGIYRALRSAELAAPWIAEALTRPRQARAALSGYERALTRDRRAGRAVQKTVERVMASRHARRWTLRRLAARHAALDALLRVTGDVDPVSSLVRPSAWLSILRRSA
jgi:flavin-dependent dehydrogenase